MACRRAACTTIACLLFACAAGRLVAEEKEFPAEHWIEQLRADDFDLRQAAAAKLEALGAAARTALERAARDSNADVRASAARLLARLSRPTMTLQLVDSEGAPIANAAGEVLVSAIDCDESRFGLFAVTGPPNPLARRRKPEHKSNGVLKADAHGSATFTLENAGQFRITIHVPGFASDFERVDAGAGDNIVRAVLRRACAISGVVRNADGTPCVGADVQIFSTRGFDLHSELLALQLIDEALEDAGRGKHAASGADGAWQVDTLEEEGAHLCVVSAPGRIPAVVGPVRVREGQTLAVPGIVLKERSFARMRLTIKGLNGKPFANASFKVAVAPLIKPEYSTRLKAKLYNLKFVYNEKEETDSLGQIEIGALPPGAFRVVVGSGGALFLSADCELTAGETRDVVLQDAVKGVVQGRVLLAGGRGYEDVEVHLVAEKDFVDAVQVMDFDEAASARSGGYYSASENSDAKGIYRFKNVPPGRYAIVVGGPADDEPRCIVFGMEVRANRRTLAPSVIANTPPAEAETDASCEVMGTVIGPDGERLEGAQIQTHIAGENSAIHSCVHGEFRVSVSEKAHGGANDYMVVRANGCKPLFVPGPFDPKKNYACRLRKQDYGDLRVRVTDEAGAPLAGVLVEPHAFGRALSRITDARGIARFAGLAAGAREFNARAEGWYLRHREGEVQVEANAEREVTLVLRRGAEISGRVNAPDGVAFDRFLVTLDGKRSRGVNGAGEFSFDAVTPGNHRLWAVGPTVTMNEFATFSVSEDAQKKNPVPVTLDVVRTGGIAIDCGKYFAGRNASLTRGVEFDSDSVNALEEIDADGRVEFSDLTPGKYMLSIEPRQRDEFSGPTRLMEALPVVGPIDVPPLETRAKLAAMPALKMDCRHGAGTLKARVRVAGRPFTSGADYVVVKVQSAGVIALGNVPDSSSELPKLWRPAPAPQIVGAAPKDFKLPAQGSFEVACLPPGDYTISARFDDDDDGVGEPAEVAPGVERKPRFKRIGAFTIADGQMLDLGELKFDAAPLRKTEDQTPDLKELLLPADQKPEFEP